MTGKWIVLDGIEGTGKTTLGKMLAEELNAVYISTNSKSNMASAIRARFKDKVKPPLSQLSYAYMMASTILENYYDYVQPALDEGKLVISDRWLPSFFVYQVCYTANPLVNEVFLNLKKELDGLKTPDQYIFCEAKLSVIQERIIARGRDDRLDNLEREIKSSMRNNFDKFFMTYAENITTPLDCSGTLENNFQQLVKIVNKPF